MTTKIAKRFRLNNRDFPWRIVNTKTGEENITFQGQLLLELYKRGRAWEIWGNEIHLPPDLICYRLQKEEESKNG